MTFVRIETIDKAAAAAILERNFNRRIRDRRVAEFADEMRAGRWRLDPSDAIVIDVNGNLINGQHRLWAVVESDTVQQFVVARGADPEAFKVMDIVTVRTGADTLTVAGEKNASLLAAALTWRLMFENANRRAATGAPYRMHSKMRPSNMAIEDALRRHPGIREYLSTEHWMMPRKLMPSSVAVWLHYEMAQIDQEMAEKFFRGVGTGEGLTRGDPRFALRRVLMDNATSTKKSSREHIAALIIRAWNAYIEGRELQLVSWRSATEPFPAISTGT